MNDLHGIVLAYRSSSSLGELTRHRNTCSLPFGGRYRLIDFMLSNFVNAGIRDVGVIVHESYQSLLDHVGTGKDWDLSRKRGGLRILPPFGYARRGSGEYRGSMEALAGVLSYLRNIRQEYVILARGDLAVNLPVDEMLRQHLDSRADITVACTDEGLSPCNRASFLTLDEGGRVADLSLRPYSAQGGLESLEITLLSRRLLLDLVEYCDAHNLCSFSREVLQPRVASLNIRGYLHKGYAARFHSVEEYFTHSMALLKPLVRADLFNPLRPIRTKDMSNPSTYYGPDARAADSLVSDGCFIEGQVERCVLSRGVVVEAGARVTDSVLMQGTVVHAGATLAYAVADKDVRVHSNRVLMGHKAYPLAIAKGSVI